jgi:pilus assembly protein CpaF
MTFGRGRLSQEVLDEVFGLGPLEPAAGPDISDILVNTYKRLYRARWLLERTNIQFH